MDWMEFDTSNILLAIFIYLIVGVRSVNYDTNISTMIQMIGHKNYKISVICKLVCLLFWPFKETMQKFLYWTVRQIDKK